MTYNDGDYTVLNHAVAGQNIVDNMDAQTVAAASDDAARILILLGRNDNNAGDMNALQAEYEENIAELKASNTNSTVYGINLLPAWEDETGVVEVDLSNIRTAILAACTAQGITCLDGYTGPGIVADDTSDGTHLTAGGNTKLANWVTAQI